MNLTLRVFTWGDRFDVVVLELRLDTGRGINRLEDRVDRAVAFGFTDDHAIAEANHDLGAGRLTAGNIDFPLPEVVDVVRRFQLIAHERDEVGAVTCFLRSASSRNR